MADTLQMAAPTRRGGAGVAAAGALAALGIVYGDIGTSPLYAFKQAADSAGSTSPEAVLGIVSLILWSLILIVAMLALLDVRHAAKGSWRASLLIVGLVGAALLYGDGVITPAISVLSAVEGLKLDAPQLAPVVVPISIVILFGLFVVQRHG